MFIYFSSQQDDEEQKKNDKKKKDRPRHSQCFKKHQSIQERKRYRTANKQSDTECVYEKKMKKKAVGRERTDSHTHTQKYIQHPSIRTNKRFFLYDHTKIHFSKKNVHIQEGYK